MKLILLLSLVTLTACGGNSSQSISADNPNGSALSLVQANASVIQLERPPNQGKIPAALRPPISE